MLGPVIAFVNKLYTMKVIMLFHCFGAGTIPEGGFFFFSRALGKAPCFASGTITGLMVTFQVNLGLLDFFLVVPGKNLWLINGAGFFYRPDAIHVAQPTVRNH